MNIETLLHKSKIIISSLLIFILSIANCFSQQQFSKSIFFIEEVRWYHDYKFIPEVLNLAREKKLKNIEFNIQKNEDYRVKVLIELVNDSIINVIREDYRNSSCRLFYYKLGIIKGLFYLKEKRFITKKESSCVCKSSNKIFQPFIDFSSLVTGASILQVFQYDTLKIMTGKFDKDFKLVKKLKIDTTEIYLFDKNNRIIKEVSTSYEYHHDDSVFICLNNRGGLGDYRYDIERKIVVDSISKKNSIKTIISKMVYNRGNENQEEYTSSIKLEYLFNKKRLPVEIKIFEIYDAKERDELTIDIKYLRGNYLFDKYYKF